MENGQPACCWRGACEEERFCLEFRGEHLEEEKFRAILDQELRDNDLPGLVSCRPDTVVIRVKEKELFNVDSIPLSGNTLLRHYEVAKWFMELDLPDLRGGFGSGSLSGGGSRSSGGGGLEDSVLETPLKAAFAVRDIYVINKVRPVVKDLLAKAADGDSGSKLCEKTEKVVADLWAWKYLNDGGAADRALACWDTIKGTSLEGKCGNGIFRLGRLCVEVSDMFM